MTTEERVEALERELARAKRRNRCAEGKPVWRGLGKQLSE